MYQAVRNRHDLNVTAMPEKYRRMADFHEYYSGARTAPYLTIFIGGNHEASNHLRELHYGGWVAPNIYYLGAANVLRIGNVRIAGLSGIWKGYDYRKPHFERLPYNKEEITSVYHVRELDTRKMMSVRTQVDIGLSHDWPKGVEWHGDYEWLFRTKRGFEDDANSGKLGNTAAKYCLDRLRPPYWFSAHLHVRYPAVIDHSADQEDRHARPMYVPAIAEAERTPIPAASSKFLRPSTPGSDSQPSPRPEHQAQVSAWHSFHDEDRAVAQAEQKERDEQQAENKASGKRSFQSYEYKETFKKVTTGSSMERKVDSPVEGDSDAEPEPIPNLDGCIHSRPSKKRRTVVDNAPQAPVGNPDAINIDSSDESEQENPLANAPLSPGHRNKATEDLKGRRGDVNGPRQSEESQNKSKSTDESHMSMTVLPASRGAEVAEQDAPAAASKGKENVPPSAPEDSHVRAGSALTFHPISDALRAELAAMSSNFAEEPKVEVSAALPFPEDITNTVTEFLALDKCEEHKDFLQLMEIGSITSPVPIQRPVKLSYDPEWLAITRVFASELVLGGPPSDKVPEHKGDTYYREQIIQSEEWVQENVVREGKLAVPENFVLTAPVYDPNLVVSSSEMPKEYTNPQTVELCGLLQIACPFDVAEEEREARGVREESAWFKDRNGRDRGGRGRGGRGRGRGR